MSGSNGWAVTSVKTRDKYINRHDSMLRFYVQLKIIIAKVSFQSEITIVAIKISVIIVSS